MITLHHDTLSITFPETARQVRAIVEQRIQRVAAELPPLGCRAELLAAIESAQNFPNLSPAQQESARTNVQTFTPAHVEGFLQKLVFDLGGVNKDAFTVLNIKLQRTTRLPDDGKAYSAPRKWGQLPLHSVDDFAETAPVAWMRKGGVILPLARSEALWIWFSSRYRFAVKIAAGTINAVTGNVWTSDLRRNPQDYFLAPDPNWDADGVARRLVAMPLDTDSRRKHSPDCKMDRGGFQFQIVPLCAESYCKDEGFFFVPPTIKEFFMRLIFSGIVSAEMAEIDRHNEPVMRQLEARQHVEPPPTVTACQVIEQDPYQFPEWNQAQTVRWFVQPCGVLAWRQITGANPPHPPLTSEDYEEVGIPWFDDYRDDGKPLPENSTVTPELIVQYGNTRRPGEIREYFDNGHRQ